MYRAVEAAITRCFQSRGNIFNLPSILQPSISTLPSTTSTTRQQEEPLQPSTSTPPPTTTREQEEALHLQLRRH